METLQLKNIKLTWLRGGVNYLDGGAMFGVVPKPLWSKKYPCNEKNQIELRTDPIFIQMDGKNILVDSGLGYGKLSEKQKRNFGALEESQVEEDLHTLGLTPADIDYILMTHLHFDHACGLTKPHEDGFVSAFPNAKIIVSKVEWDEMRQPNIRSKNTYWKENWACIQEQVHAYEKEWSLGAIKMVHTGGHSDGHSILVIEDGEELLIHMADIMPTHAHKNVLWVLAYDDYPMNSIAAKEKWMEYGLQKNAWFTFYHDAYYRAVKWNNDGELVDKLSRER
ncbi:glyoxylase-like metal-dependent hydrolase (beta-lactamase superfamily II) [Cytobacillus eiseniae]|uniref:Glyoxylase-like metal-dependent hydrolase (Beta-lactamase superfamily II) n=1 Tax=Cytobacillus eiseniae TaxID=762947 RepID=A0ABS4REX0_9BACI|nr:MBL fold metallo-hydrolase [Cytobacillus eiseniae]MBP2241456.1 glyoxylase-like metal-dependent hydrolase (beta-lactamase superfamily II) [Cytobacillus eiseniae]